MSGTTKSCLRVLGVALVAPLMLGQVCTPGGGQPKILVNQVVNVPGGGGGGEVSFYATSGQTIRITLTAAQTSMLPYGHLETPDGSGEDYLPPLETASNGSNTIQVTLTQTVTYRLVIFDGSNEGGNVTVRVELL